MLSRRQVTVQRENLTSMCRISVKCLLDYASLYNHVNDDCEEFINFCAVFEQLVSHRLQPYQKKTWLSVQGSPRHFWDVLLDNSHRTRGLLYQSCIPNIEAIGTIKSPKAKLRAFIRVALMEKRLSDYLSWVRENKYLMRESYLDGALMISEEAALIFGELIGLNAIDFNFCLKGNENELLGPLEISYSPFLTYKQSCASQCSDEIEMLRLSGKDVAGLKDTSSIFVESNMNDVLRVQNLEKDMRQIKEQKDYLEELLRLRERQLTEANIKIENANIEWQRAEKCIEKERLTMEACILELQKEMAKLQKSNDSLRAQLSASKHYKQRTELKEAPNVEVATSGSREVGKSVMHVHMETVYNRSAIPQAFSEQPFAVASVENSSLTSGLRDTKSQDVRAVGLQDVRAVGLQDVSAVGVQDGQRTAALLGTQPSPHTEVLQSQHKQQLSSSHEESFDMPANSNINPEGDQATLEHPLQLEVKVEALQPTSLMHYSDPDLKDHVPKSEINNSAACLDISCTFVVAEPAVSGHHVLSLNQGRSLDLGEAFINHSNSNTLALSITEHSNPVLCNETNQAGGSALDSLSVAGREQVSPAAPDDKSSNNEFEQEKEVLA
ncbi:hypothetical protein BsWGS_09358 [Bradybaena similaris]